MCSPLLVILLLLLVLIIVIGLSRCSLRFAASNDETQETTKPKWPRGSAHKQRAFLSPNGRPMARCDRLMCRYGNRCARAIGTKDCLSWSSARHRSFRPRSEERRVGK